MPNVLRNTETNVYRVQFSRDEIVALISEAAAQCVGKSSRVDRVNFLQEPDGINYPQAACLVVIEPEGA